MQRRFGGHARGGDEFYELSEEEKDKQIKRREEKQQQPRQSRPWKKAEGPSQRPHHRMGSGGEGNSSNGFNGLPSGDGRGDHMDSFLGHIVREQSKSRERRMSRGRSRSQSRGKGQKAGTYEKYMPPKKEEIELFDESRQIQKGDKFKELYQKQQKAIVFQTNTDGLTAKKLDRYCKNFHNFEKFGLSKEIMLSLKLKKMDIPTPIQKMVMPAISKKRNDLIAHAPTGDGKTASYLLPIINELQSVVASRGGTVNTDSPYAIIVSPTKELATQLYEDAQAFTLNTGVAVVRTFGHIPFKASVNELLTGCDIFIATCGRLRQFVEDNLITLEQLRYLVLDEADKLLEIQNFQDCIRFIRKQKLLNPEHRVLMFSATYSERVKKTAEELLRPDFIRVQIGQENSPAETVKQEFFMVPKLEKLETFKQFLLNNNKTKLSFKGGKDHWSVPKTIVFVEEKRRAFWLAGALGKANIEALCITADLTLRLRCEAVAQFSTDECDVLVATDVAARGLNFPNVEFVVNYDLPSRDSRSSQDEYIHRIGRTGRIGNEGRSISYLDPTSDRDCRNAAYFMQKLQESGELVPDWLSKIVDEQKQRAVEFSQQAETETNNGTEAGESLFSVMDSAGEKNGFKSRDSRAKAKGKEEERAGTFSAGGGMKPKEAPKSLDNWQFEEEENGWVVDEEAGGEGGGGGWGEEAGKGW